MVDFTDLNASLAWLAKRGFVSGSWARGDQRHNSDIDVYLSEGHVKALKRQLTNQGVEWDSPFPCSITWYPGGMQVETSVMFPRYKTGPKVVHGIEFRT